MKRAARHPSHARQTSSASHALLLQMLDEGYERKTWHGPNLRGSLHGVSAKDAAWRPGRGRHNIWEEAVHAAYWKYAVRRRIESGKPGGFALRGSNFFARPEGKPGEAAWRRDRKLLEQEHRKLRAAVAKLGRREMNPANVRQILGVAFHDIYHAGQIRLLRRLRGIPR
jgi:hypothetical protein